MLCCFNVLALYWEASCIRYIYVFFFNVCELWRKTLLYYIVLKMYIRGCIGSLDTVRRCFLWRPMLCDVLLRYDISTLSPTQCPVLWCSMYFEHTPIHQRSPTWVYFTYGFGSFCIFLGYILWKHVHFSINLAVTNIKINY